jgi:hypothetical protein
VKPSVTTPRIGLAGAVVNGKIYAIGGGTSGGTLARPRPTPRATRG